MFRPRRLLARHFLSTRHPAPPSRCPQCHAPLPTPLPACPACAFIAAVSPDVSYHALFGIHDSPNPFVVDQALLKQRFRDAQRICHPDAWAGKDQHKQDLSGALSTHLNHAYQALVHPYARAEYLLRRAGLPLTETDQLDDPDLIMEVMETQEAIQDAGPDDEHTIREIGKRNQEKMQEAYKTIENLAAAQDWPTMKEVTVRLKYLQNIDSAVQRWPTLGNDDH